MNDFQPTLMVGNAVLLFAPPTLAMWLFRVEIREIGARWWDVLYLLCLFVSIGIYFVIAVIAHRTGRDELILKIMHYVGLTTIVFLVCFGLYQCVKLLDGPPLRG